MGQNLFILQFVLGLNSVSVLNCFSWKCVCEMSKTYPGYCQTKLNRRLARWSGEVAVIFFSTRGVINGRSSNDCTQLGACRRLPVVIELNQPIGGKASLVIGSHKKHIGSKKRNVLLLSRPCCRANSEWTGGTQSK